MLKSKKDRKSISQKMNVHDNKLQLRPLEEDLLHAAEVGDLLTVQNLLKAHGHDLNVNATDMMGRSPLRLAAGNEHLQVVQLLLDHTDFWHVYDALLNAITCNHEDVCDAILTYPNYPRVRETCQASQHGAGGTSGGDGGAGGSSQFPPEITPVILAAQLNRYETLMVLLNMGERIPHPHAIDCRCDECTSAMEQDELRFARSRLNQYLGLASEAYLSLATSDPVMASFKLTSELKKVARGEKYYKKEYDELAGRLGDYSVGLLNNVRGNDELDVFLSAAGGTGVDLAAFGRLPRLKLAIHYEQKKFVAHPACQMKLLSIMYGELQFLNHYRFITKAAFFLALLLLYPVLVLCYWVAPYTKVGRVVCVPMVKFLTHTASYLIYLMLIISFSISEKQIQLNQRPLINFSAIHESSKPYPHLHQMAKNLIVRPYHMNGYLQWLFIILLCMVWEECKQIYSEGIKGYNDSALNWIEFFLLKFYLASFTLRFLVLVKVNIALNYFGDTKSWEYLNQNDVTAATHLYWISADRFLWDPFDPQALSEGLFAVANVFSFTRLSYFLAIDDSLGPLQLSLRLMITDVMKFTIIFLLFVMAFVVGIHNLYWFYEPDVLSYVSIGRENLTLDFPAEAAFGSIPRSMKTVFWALFGMADADVVELGDFPNQITEMVGFALFATYSWVMVIILLNMLIAMMSRSFEVITDDQDVEWKFSLTHLYMDYIKDVSTLPPPLNLIPTPRSVLRLFRCCCRETTVEDVEIPNDIEVSAADTIEIAEIGKESVFNGVEAEKTAGSKGDATYISVIKKVLKRYISKQVLTNSVVSNEEIKQDISSFRFEVLGQLNQTCRGTDATMAALGSVQKRQTRAERDMAEIREKLDQVLAIISSSSSLSSSSSSSLSIPRFGDTHRKPISRLREDTTIDANQTYV